MTQQIRREPPPIPQVGRTVIKGSGKKRILCYRDAFCDEDGWVDAHRFLPAEYDLVFLKHASGKTREGWRSGICWDGLKIDKTKEVIYWKRKLESSDE